MANLLNEPIVYVLGALAIIWLFNRYRKQPQLQPQQPFTFWDGIGRLFGGFVIGAILAIILIAIGLSLK